MNVYISTCKYYFNFTIQVQSSAILETFIQKKMYLIQKVYRTRRKIDCKHETG